MKTNIFGRCCGLGNFTFVPTLGITPMRYQTLFVMVLGLLSNTITAQTREIINPKGRWFFGAEVGLNSKMSVPPSKMSFMQGGFLAEYFFAKNWSVSGRLKYFETGVINPMSDGSKGFFEGAVISVPLNIVWRYRIVENFSGNLNLGLAINQEVKSNYHYQPNEATDYDKLYASFNAGIGCSYFISKYMALYMNYEAIVLGNDRDEADLFEILPNSPNNSLLSIGIKYSFKK
ncbi:outer membrane beta-barrel protein [Riemerella anatipestifer]|nr:outer membrane beta-barrel protein [Riemerella anatipestifer]MDY3325661.1 outer membrane beta-barrel protein [Riemerella anatipestifer]MDY3354203.1 outer membrane beta-barrel protein [Riemerella anatipestifer]